MMNITCWKPCFDIQKIIVIGKATFSLACSKIVIFFTLRIVLITGICPCCEILPTSFYPLQQSSFPNLLNSLLFSKRLCVFPLECKSWGLIFIHLSGETDKRSELAGQMALLWPIHAAWVFQKGDVRWDCVIS
jgi:hypothetical protein